MPETLAAGDLTTAYRKWLDGKGWPKNEVIRAALNTAHTQTEPDIQENLANFLRKRVAP